MGEIFLAVKEGIGGFQRLVVIKRLLPKLEQQQRTRDMFLSEARLAAALHHPSVVQILDVGRDEHGHFMAMEYLSGENLLTLLKALHTRAERIPVEIVCAIGAAVAAGLHSAHTATDGAGNPRPIIHRDVTPANLIVCYNGAVKIVDFGIAKVTDVDDRTHPGTIKGKYAYLAPEQVEGDSIDVRTDVFQLGIVMHEMLTGRRLFKGQTEHQTMNAVLSRPIVHPSAENADVPRELDELVLWMLRRPRDERPQSADEVRRALSDWVKKSGRTVTQDDVGAWMKSTFEDLHESRLAMERACYARASSAGDGVVEVPYVEPTAEYSSASGGYSGPEALPYLGAGTHSGAPSESRAPSQPGDRPTTLPTAAPSRRRSWLIATLLLLIGATVAAIAMTTDDEATAAGPRQAANPAATPEAPAPALPVADAAPDVTIEPVAVDLTTVPHTARIELDGAEVGAGAFRGEVEPDREHQLRVTADGYVPQVVHFTDTPPNAIVLEVAAIAEALDDDPPARRRKSRAKTRTRTKSRPKPTPPPEPTKTAAAPPPDESTSPPTNKRRRKKLSDNKNPWADQ